MIIARLEGGLGNQMFQYAAGRRLAHRLDVELKLDASWFAKQTKRRYGLAEFRTRASVCSPSEEKAANRTRWGLIGYGLRRLLSPQRGPRLRLFRERRSYHFDPRVLSLPDNVCLRGFWQCAQYFSDIGEIIREEFRMRVPPAGENQKLLHEISSCSSIGVHVRRGDYVRESAVYERYHHCTMTYYHQAVEHIVSRDSAAQIFVFSDDPCWARENLVFKQPTKVVDHNGTDGPHEDLRLMTHCLHSVIANSSFSWWGAWLKRRPGGTVVAPKRWLRNGACSGGDLIPEQWVTL